MRRRRPHATLANRRREAAAARFLLSAAQRQLAALPPLAAWRTELARFSISDKAQSRMQSDRLAIVAFSALSRLMTRGSAPPADRRPLALAPRLGRVGAQTRDARKATKVLEDHRDRNPVAIVMLLSDT